MEQPKDTTDELYVLSFIAGLCNQESRDELLLGDLLMYLRVAQRHRDVIWSSMSDQDHGWA